MRCPVREQHGIRLVYEKYTVGLSRCNAIDALGQKVIMRAMGRERFSRFETIAQRLIERSLNRLVGEDALVAEIALGIARSMDDGRRNGLIPSTFEVALNPVDHRALEAQNPHFPHRLESYAIELARRGELNRRSHASVVIVSDETLPPRHFEIATRQNHSTGDTTDILNYGKVLALDRLRALDAFLIIGGKRHVPLSKPLVTIGRYFENDVIIDSPAVSRRHAHIRWRHERFVVYDLGSRGGITVNGEPCRESVLRPGDLISLSNKVSIIYGEGLENRGEIPARVEQDQDTQAFPENGD